MKETNEKQTGLPENAFRPLKPGEQYHPLMSPDKNYQGRYADDSVLFL